MKQTVGATVTLVILLLFCILCVYTVGREAKTAIELTEKAFHAQEREAAVSAVIQAEEFWRSREWFFGTVLRHDDLEDVVQLYSIIAVYAQREDWDDYYGNCAALLARLEHISVTERFRLQNIM